MQQNIGIETWDRRIFCVLQSMKVKPDNNKKAQIPGHEKVLMSTVINVEIKPIISTNNMVSQCGTVVRYSCIRYLRK